LSKSRWSIRWHPASSRSESRTGSGAAKLDMGRKVADGGHVGKRRRHFG
jgi:hypothetical protein